MISAQQRALAASAGAGTASAAVDTRGQQPVVTSSLPVSDSKSEKIRLKGIFAALSLAVQFHGISVAIQPGIPEAIFRITGSSSTVE